MMKGFTSGGKKTLEKPHQRRDQCPNPLLDAYDYGERGFWCDSCGCKCVLGTDMESEYGHERSCEYAIEK